MSNSFGRILKITTYGESHGEAIGVIIDGFPAGIEIDLEKIRFQLERRKPGQSRITSPRKENERFQILSGVFNGKSLGSPISIQIPNEDKRSGDYDHVENSYRPGHADFTYDFKYGIRDHKGGGRSSARETANWVAAGALAYQILEPLGITIRSFVSQVGNIKLDRPYEQLDLNSIDTSIVRCPDVVTAEEMIKSIEEARLSGDSLGGVIRCVIKNVPPGWGEPIFDKLQARLARAMMSINAVKGFQYGSGFASASMKGSEHNDQFVKEKDKIRTKTNNAGGILGGISNGEDIYFDIAFKPVSSIMQDQETVDKNGERTLIKGKGRHDPCVVPRAVPIVDALSALVLADFYLLSKTSKL